MRRVLGFIVLLAGVTGTNAAATGESAATAPAVPIRLPDYAKDAYVHETPTLEALEASDSIHPRLKKVIRRGRDLFMDTQQLRGEHVFNDMDCKSCHMGEGAMNWAAPVWPAATTLPDYRGKNDHVNSLEERIAGCFAFSMNGRPPAYGSDIMVALVAYHKWLATGARMYEQPIGGRGFSHLGKQMPEAISYDAGEKVYQKRCAICHGADGGGRKVAGEVVFPALWGDESYNWGAGMTRVFTAASFIRNNMPLGQPGSLSDEEAWNVAYFVNAHERPQDPRYTGDVTETREKFLNFHKHTLYGKRVNGELLGDHERTGSKGFLRPEVLRPRDFGG